MSGIDNIPALCWLRIISAVVEDPDPLVTLRSRAQTLASLAAASRGLSDEVRAFGWEALAQRHVGPLVRLHVRKCAATVPRLSETTDNMVTYLWRGLWRHDTSLLFFYREKAVSDLLVAAANPTRMMLRVQAYEERHASRS